MGFLVDNLNLIIQIILIFVIIIQTSYIGTTMKFNQRITQYDLTREWRQKLAQPYIQSGTIPHITDNNIENEFQELVDIFYDMHLLFKDKLLKPLDFIPQFARLHHLVLLESQKQTDSFKSNHIQLQFIYHNFNKTDVAMNMLDCVDLETLDKFKEKIGKDTVKGMGVDVYKKNYLKWVTFLKIVMWCNIKIKKTSIFKLPEID